MDLFKEQLDQVESRISRLEGKKGEDTYDYYERHIIFELRHIYAWGGGSARSATILGLPQGHSQRCYYYLAHGIVATVDPSLEVFADMPLQ